MGSRYAIFDTLNVARASYGQLEVEDIYQLSTD